MHKNTASSRRPPFHRLHGEGLAHVVTALRIPISVGAGILTITKDGGTSSVTANIVTDGSDWLDGWLSKNNETSEPPYSMIGNALNTLSHMFNGAWGDRTADHLSQNIRRGALVLRGLVDPVDFIVPMVRDHIVDTVRDEKKHTNTVGVSSSINIGRAKTVAMAGAFAYSATRHARRHPNISRKAHRYCTYLSVIAGAITIVHEKKKQRTLHNQSRSGL